MASQPAAAELAELAHRTSASASARSTSAGKTGQPRGRRWVGTSFTSTDEARFDLGPSQRPSLPDQG
jgi:hypothetical protein